VIVTTAAVAAVVIVAIIISATIFGSPALSASVTGASTTTLTKYAISTTASIAGLPNLSSIEKGSVPISGTSIVSDYFQVDANDSRVYLPGAAGDNLTVLDATTGTLVTTIELPGSPTSVAIDTKTGILYVNVQECSEMLNASNPCGSATVPSEIAKVNTSTDAVVGAIPVKMGGLAVDPESDTLFGAYDCPSPQPQAVPSAPYPCGYLYAINAQSGSVMANVSMGAALLGISVDSKTNVVYVHAYGPASTSLPEGAQELLIVNGTTLAVQSRISLDFINGVNVADDPNTNVVYVLAGNGTSSDLLALNGTSGNLIYSSVVGSACSVNPNELVVNPFSDQVYLYAENYPQISELFLVVNGATGSVSSIFSIDGGPVQTAVNSQSGSVYVLLTKSLLILPALPTSGSYDNTSLLAGAGCIPPIPV
jgi:hypothetical protein